MLQFRLPDSPSTARAKDDSSFAEKKRPWGTAESVDLSGRGWELKGLLQDHGRASYVSRLSLAGNADMGQKLADFFAEGRASTPLSRLLSLDISDNRVQSLEPLLRLSSLEELNATGNCIDKIPAGLSRLKSLRKLQLARNSVRDLSAFARLANLSNLSELTVAGNPATDMPHTK